MNDHVLNEHATSLFCEVIEPSQVLEIPIARFLKVMQEDFVRNITESSLFISTGRETW